MEAPMSYTTSTSLSILLCQHTYPHPSTQTRLNHPTSNSSILPLSGHQPTKPSSPSSARSPPGAPPTAQGPTQSPPFPSATNSRSPHSSSMLASLSGLPALASHPCSSPPSPKSTAANPSSSPRAWSSSPHSSDAPSLPTSLAC